MTNLILYNVTDKVATVTLNRPDKYNALNSEMTENLKTAFHRIKEDEGVRAVLLTANGKGFCAGQDLTEFEKIREQGVSAGEHLREGYNKLITQMRDLQKPIVCAIDGVAAGTGASLTLGADLRIATKDASFVFGAFIGIGLIPDSGATYLLPQIIGQSRAFELFTLSDGKNRLSAETAHQWGLVSVVAPENRLMLEATSIAERLADRPTTAVWMMKSALYTNINHDLSEALEYEAKLQDIAAETRDHKEGVRAFLEKRKPHFTGE